MGMAANASRPSSGEVDTAFSWLELVLRHELLRLVALEEFEIGFSLDDKCA